jgi:hypothetical protein
MRELPYGEDGRQGERAMGNQRQVPALPFFPHQGEMRATRIRCSAALRVRLGRLLDAFRSRGAHRLRAATPRRPRSWRRAMSS